MNAIVILYSSLSSPPQRPLRSLRLNNSDTTNIYLTKNLAVSSLFRLPYTHKTR